MPQHKNLVLCLALLILAACREQILHDLDELEANKILTRLNQGGVEAQKIKQADGNWGIEVESSHSMQALNLLNAARALKRSAEIPNKKSDLLSSREEQRFAFERAISHELERTIVSMPGVLEARVHLNMPAADPIFGQDISSGAKSSASVLLVCELGFQNKVEQIQALVSGAAGIEADKVTVIISSDHATDAAADWRRNNAEGNLGLEEKIVIAEKTNFIPEKISQLYEQYKLLFWLCVGGILLYGFSRGKSQFRF